MAREIHDPDALTADYVMLVLTWNEPGTCGLTRRWHPVGIAALSVALVFKPAGVRCAYRLLSTQEREAYVANRVALDAGAGV
jgi:hypothetical protein